MTFPSPRGAKSIRRSLAAAAASAAFLLLPRTAEADVSSWFFAGAGQSWTSGGDEATERNFLLHIDAGMGTPPRDTIIFGGIGRMQTHFGQGTDLALLMRVATHGFVNGDWGAAIDLGGYQRWWGIGSTGYEGSLVLGAPWGITLVGTGARGTNDGQMFGIALGIDLARLTVYRRTGDTWWKNPFPLIAPTKKSADLR